MKTLIAITMGDAAGIGPEIIAKTLALQEVYDLCRPFVIGDSGAMRMGIEVSHLKLGIEKIRVPEEGLFKCGIIDILSLDNINTSSLMMGRPQPMAGKASVEYVLKAAELAMKGEVDAIVTAPLSKEAMNMAGYNYPGHTELLAEYSGAKDYAMMLIADNLRVVHVTTHVSLREVPDLITREKVLRMIKVAADAAKSLGFHEPKIAVAGLNPHSGEDGLFGREENEEIRPAIEEARRFGLNVEGPVPPDTVFAKAAGGVYDIVVAMYHDQGHIPVKMQGFRYGKGGDEFISGVNVTVGLPFIRTSVDHGTAYGRAGRCDGTADPTSMLDAVKVAVKLAEANSLRKRMSWIG